MDSKDQAFEEWVSGCVLEEAAEMIKEMEKNPETDKFVPSRELYEQILKKARKRGILDKSDE